MPKNIVPSYEEVVDLFMGLTSVNKRIPDFESEILPIIGTPRMMKDNEVPGVFFKKIGNPHILFTAHYDTAGDSNVLHSFDDELPHIVSNSGDGILGADDKAGITVLKFMMDAEIEGLYVFFGDEECGSTQSKRWINTDYSKKCNLEKDIEIAIAFDRKDYGDLIVKQHGESCCSDKFANMFIKILAKYGLFYKKTPGVFTDTANMVYKINECTNLSIGYFGHHTSSETQDLMFLHKMIEVMIIGADDFNKLISYQPVRKEKIYEPISGNALDIWHGRAYSGRYRGYYDADSGWENNGGVFTYNGMSHDVSIPKEDVNVSNKKKETDGTSEEDGCKYIDFRYGIDTDIGRALDGYTVDNTLIIDTHSYISDIEDVIGLMDKIPNEDYIEAIRELALIGDMLEYYSARDKNIAVRIKVNEDAAYSTIVTYPDEFFLQEMRYKNSLLEEYNEKLYDVQ